MNEEHFEEIFRYYKDTKYNPRRETLHTRVSDAYPILKETADDREVIPYSVLARQIETDERRYLSVVLGTITRMEDLSGRPPLSAVAVQKNERIPNDVFFQLLEQLAYSPEGVRKREIFEYIRDDLAAEWA